MTITVHSIGRFKEVSFRDAEDEDVRARSGLLDADQAMELSQRLREVADALTEVESADQNQTVLPFYGGYAGGMFAHAEGEASGARKAVGY
jgi:hypothetical protein